MDYSNRTPKSISQKKRAAMLKRYLAPKDYNARYGITTTPALTRSSSQSSDDGKIYYNAEANISHLSVPHDPYSICVNYTNCSMSSPVYNADYVN